MAQQIRVPIRYFVWKFGYRGNKFFHPLPGQLSRNLADRVPDLIILDILEKISCKNLSGHRADGPGHWGHVFFNTPIKYWYVFFP